jgi:hypothetical protein
VTSAINIILPCVGRRDSLQPTHHTRGMAPLRNAVAVPAVLLLMHIATLVVSRGRIGARTYLGSAAANRFRKGANLLLAVSRAGFRWTTACIAGHHPNRAAADTCFSTHVPHSLQPLSRRPDSQAGSPLQLIRTHLHETRDTRKRECEGNPRRHNGGRPAS